MHCPRVFQESRVDVLCELVRQYPLATVISHGAQGLEVNVLPCLLQRQGEQIFLHAHMAKNNDQLHALANSDNVLWVFQGPNAYVSPSWYPSKQQHGKMVPTWNYMVVEVAGKIRLYEDADSLLTLLEHTTNEHEQHRSETWQVGDAPEAFIQAQLRGIVGIEVEVTKIQGKFKLSQNRSEMDYAGVVEGMKADNAQHEILEWMAEPKTASSDISN